jgi:hypothetical protein
MSSLYVRDTLRGWLRDPALGLVLPFIDTVNVEADAPKIGARVPWATLNFVSSFSETISYCGHIEERGSVDYIALGTAGVGDRELIAAAEHDVAIVLAQLDRYLTLREATPPDDFVQAGSVPWYTVSMTINYTYERPLVVA